MSIHWSLTQLARIGYIELCTGTDGKRYGRIPKFEKHQRINRPSPSRIKDLWTFTDNSVSDHGTVSEDSHPELGTGNGEQGNGEPGTREQGTGEKQQGAHETSAPAQGGNGRSKPRTANRFDEFWQLYPSRRGKKRAREIWLQKNLDAHADEILHDVRERQRRDQRWIGGYVPNPTTYLNQERWEDEFGAPADQTGSHDWVKERAQQAAEARRQRMANSGETQS